MLIETFISLHKVGGSLLAICCCSKMSKPFPLLVKTKQLAEIGWLLLNVKFYF